MNAQQQTLISIARCGDPHNRESVDAAVREALDLIGGLSSVMSQGDRVLIKPNILGPYSYESGAVTNPSVVGAIITAAMEAGAREVVVAESSFVGNDTDESFKVSGITALCAERGARLVNLDKDDPVPVVVPGGKVLKRLSVPKTALSADVIINVPVMKTHILTQVTLSLKNAKGLVCDQIKKRIHKRGLVEGIVDLNRVLAPDLVVIDGTIGMEGWGPMRGEPANRKLIVASADPVAADASCAAIMGFDPNEIDHIRRAGEEGLGTADLSTIRIVGKSLEEVKKPFKRLRFNLEDLPGVNIIEEAACSGCFYSVQAVIAHLNKNKQMNLLDGYTLVLGQTVKLGPELSGKERLLLLGNCLRMYKKHGDYVPGCPPQATKILEKLESR